MNKIVLDQEKCTGLGICESLAPDYFEVDESGDLVLLKETIDETDTAEIDNAINSCPTRALRRK